MTANFLPLVGGLEVYIDRAVSALSDHCSVALVTQHGQGPATDPRVRCIPIPKLSRPATLAEWTLACRHLADEVERFQPHVVHLANAGMGVYRSVLPPDLPVVATVHGNDLSAPWQWVPGRDARSAIVEGLSACDRIVAVSSHTASLLGRYGVAAPVHVVAAGCDTAFFRPIANARQQVCHDLGIQPDRALVLTVGRLVPRKGHHSILEALCALRTEVHWLVVGDGPLRSEVTQAIAASPMAEDATLLGHVSLEELRLLYSACNLFVLVPEEREQNGMLDSEGFGLVFQEAGACGCAVIGSDISGCRDAIIDGATGLLVPPADPAALAAAIKQLLSDPAFARSLGAAAQSFVRASGGWPRFASQMLEIYQELAPAP